MTIDIPCPPAYTRTCVPMRTASKRVLRALLKATNVCALGPEWAAQLLMDKGYAKSYD